jgi:hypothetical protein
MSDDKIRLEVAIDMLKSQWDWAQRMAEDMAVSPGMDLQPEEVLQVWRELHSVEEYILENGMNDAFQYSLEIMSEPEFDKLFDASGMTEENRFVPKHVTDCYKKMSELCFKRAHNAPKQSVTGKGLASGEGLMLFLKDNFASKKYYIDRSEKFLALAKTVEEGALIFR